MTQCTCTCRGFCPVLGVAVTEQLRQVCIKNHTRALEIAGALKRVDNQNKADRRKVREQLRETRNRLIEWVKLFRADSDKGVGDTVERLLAKVGGRKIKSLIESLGGSCGCTNRQKWLNQVYPYKT